MKNALSKLTIATILLAGSACDINSTRPTSVVQETREDVDRAFADAQRQELIDFAGWKPLSYDEAVRMIGNDALRELFKDLLTRRSSIREVNFGQVDPTSFIQPEKNVPQFTFIATKDGVPRTYQIQGLTYRNSDGGVSVDFERPVVSDGVSASQASPE